VPVERIVLTRDALCGPAAWNSQSAAKQPRAHHARSILRAVRSVSRSARHERYLRLVFGA
jgi:hypothetical protein